MELGLWSLKSLELMKWFDIKNVYLSMYLHKICFNRKFWKMPWTVNTFYFYFSRQITVLLWEVNSIQYRTNLVKYLLIFYILNHEPFKCKCIFQVLAQIGVSNVLLEALFWQYQNVLSDVLSMEFFTGSFNGWLPK